MLLNIEDDLTPDQLANVHVGGMLSEKEFLNKVEQQSVNLNLSADELDRLVQVVISRVFKMLTSSNPSSVSSVPTGHILENLVARADLTPMHIRLLVDGWCREVLAPLQFLNSGMVDQFISVRLLPFAVMSQVAGRADCPLSLLGRLWRMTRLVEGDLDESSAVLRELLGNPTVPSAFALRLKTSAVPKAKGELLTDWDGYRRAMSDYPDIADLPVGMFVEVLSCLPIPDEWFAEMDQDFGEVIWVAPGIRNER